MKPVLKVLISVPRPFAGALRVNCEICQAYAYESQENLSAIRADSGYVICCLCAVELKKKQPSSEYGGLLLGGKVTSDELLSPSSKAFIDFLSRKP